VSNGNLRKGQKVNKAPVTHYLSHKNYTAPAEIVATHRIAGTQVGDKVGVTTVHSILTGLKYLHDNAQQSEMMTLPLKMKI
jgi:hypothetical protein